MATSLTGPCPLPAITARPRPAVPTRSESSRSWPRARPLRGHEAHLHALFVANFATLFQLFVDVKPLDLPAITHGIVFRIELAKRFNRTHAALSLGDAGPQRFATDSIRRHGTHSRDNDFTNDGFHCACQINGSKGQYLWRCGLMSRRVGSSASGSGPAG